MQIYSEQGDYLLADNREADPAYPGQSPEPYENHTLHLPRHGVVTVPCALTFIRDHGPDQLDVIDRMLDALPGRKLVRISGHGNGSDWMAGNRSRREPEKHGSWLIGRAKES